MNRHPPHPKCPSCGRALYKSALKGGKVAKGDPWAFCRNEACVHHGVNQTMPRPTSPPSAGSELGKQTTTVKHTHRRLRRRTVPAPTPMSKEPDTIRNARQRIRSIVKSVVHDKERSAVQLVLAMVNQETGNTAAANCIIKEYRLDELFGLKCF
jgi:hypothetical protein